MGATGLRRQPVRGKRALPACAGNRAVAHHQHAAPGARFARAPGHSKPSAFTRQRDVASASVTLELRGDQQLERSQVDAIVHMVAASIRISPGTGDRG